MYDVFFFFVHGYSKTLFNTSLKIIARVHLKIVVDQKTKTKKKTKQKYEALSEKPLKSLMELIANLLFFFFKKNISNNNNNKKPSNNKSKSSKTKHKYFCW